MRISVVRWWVMTQARVRTTAPARWNVRRPPVARTAPTVRVMIQRKKQTASDS
jgi:hypothetical protein